MLRRKARDLVEKGCLDEAKTLLSKEPDLPATRDLWLLLAERAARDGRFVLAEYAYKKGLGLGVLW
ncbi:MAG: hypothetical protein U9R40_07690 [Synergistota bacterium]|nr:hypothetical protein [Synergistota bacterium]